MANNFLNMDVASNAKNSTDCLLNLLQLNLMGGNQSNNVGGAGLNGGLGANNGPGLFGSSGGGGGGANGMMQQQQSPFYQQSAGVGNYRRLASAIGLGSSGGMSQKPGRAITNTGNLANNHYSQQQQDHHQQPDIFSQSAMGGSGNSIGSGMKKEMHGGNDFKQTFRSHSTGSDIMSSNSGKSYRNGDGKFK